MNDKLGWLGGLLLAQLVLIAVIFVAPSGREEAPPQLLDFAVAAVDRLSVSDGESQLEVARAEHGWQVAGVPADADKVADILGKLAGIDAPWPVATSSASAARFEVAEDDFQRRVTLFSGDAQIAQLYLGTSPGYQRVHARRADSDEVFSVALSNYEIGVEVDNWIDKGVLEMAAAPTRIEVTLREDGVATELVATDEGWLVNGAAADQDAAATYANRFTTLRVLGLADDTTPDAASLTEQGRIALSNADETRNLVISRAGEDDYVIGSGDSPVQYRLATYIAEQLLMADEDFSVQDADAS